VDRIAVFFYFFVVQKGMPYGKNFLDIQLL